MCHQVSQGTGGHTLHSSLAVPLGPQHVCGPVASALSKSDNSPFAHGLFLEHGQSLGQYLLDIDLPPEPVLAVGSRRLLALQETCYLLQLPLGLNDAGVQLENFLEIVKALLIILKGQRPRRRPFSSAQECTGQD